MKKKLLYFLLLICFIPTAHAEKLKCPPESYLVDFPGTGIFGARQFCMKTIEGVRVKHGPEKLFNIDGTLKSFKYYNLGKIVEKDATKSAAESSKGLSNEDSNALKVLVISVFGKFIKKNIELGAFKTNKCKSIKNSEIFGLLTKGKKITKHYKFKNPGCDINGKVNYTKKPFKMLLGLKNLGAFNKTDMLLTLIPQLALSEGHINLTIDAQKAYISSEDKKIEFTAEYKLKFDLFGKLINDGGGVININSFNGKPVSQSIPLKLDV